MTSIESFYRGVASERPIEPIPLSEPIPLEALHTPALVIDLDQYEQNLSTMQRHLDQYDIALRAHTKMHKCPVIARDQVKLGARGVCAAKISEAEVMCAAGVEDVLVTSPVASEEKIRRFMNLRLKNTGLKIVVDDATVVSRFNEIASAEGLTLQVFIDIDPAMGRTGIEAGQPTLELARTIAETKSLRLAGLQMYAGHCMHIEGFENRRDRYHHVMERGAETLEMLKADGLDVSVFSGGGTGTYNIEPDLGVINELQAGSYAFMDIEYRDIGGDGTEQFTDFPVSLFVLVTAISKPQSRLVTVDGGFKSFASDKMPPQFRDVEGVVYHWGGDEHGIIQLDNPSREIRLGDKLPMLTPHCDPTVNLHDFYFPFRDGVVSEIWPVTARGFSQ